MSQYAVWVEFGLLPQHADAFRTAVLKNAHTSVATEPGCLRFDVLDALPGAPRIFLYEIYADEAAFKAHLGTEHYKVFDRESAPWITEKVVKFGAVTQITKS